GVALMPALRRTSLWSLLAFSALALPAGAAAEPKVVHSTGTAVPPADARKSPRVVSLTADERELADIELRGQLEVERLLTAARGLPDGPALRAVQRDGVAGKAPRRPPPPG